MIRLVEQNVTGVFNAVGPESTLTMEQLLSEINTGTAGSANFIWTDEEFLLNQDVQPWGEIPLWIPEEFPLPGNEKPWTGFLSVDHQKAIRQGLTFRPLSEIIKDVYEWEQARGDYVPKAGMDREREKQLLRNYREIAIY